MLVHLQHHPGPEPIEVANRCAKQYKCRDGFSHLPYYLRVHGVEVRYHYTESGHGKGPSDGIGANVKQKLDRWILNEKVPTWHCPDP